MKRNVPSHGRSLATDARAFQLTALSADLAAFEMYPRVASPELPQQTPATPDGTVRDAR
jgi:hypothetical protein